MKYMGSKRKIVSHILPIILKDKEKYDCYVEPFCGSLSVIEQVDGIKKIASDVNPFIIAMWRCLQDFQYDGEKVDFLEYLITIRGIVFNGKGEYFIGKETYNNWRSEYNLYKKCEYNDNFLTHYAIIGFVGYMAGFNGRFYDGGYSGKANKRNYVDEQIRNTLSQTDKLKEITFYCCDYNDLLNEISLSKTPFIFYMDPPYKNTKEYSTKNFDYDNFYQQCRRLHELGHKVFISEYQMPDDFSCVWEMEITNSLNPKITKKPIEKLFTL
jgi:DNA adenine methylase